MKFYAFSMLVTLLQYLLLTFLPGLFYTYTDWCCIPCQLFHLKFGSVDTYVFNYPVTGDETGGMGYFAAFAITLFLAQCVSFPMQRNITFKSKGNVWYQIGWYVVAFVLITIACSFLIGLYLPLCRRFFFSCCLQHLCYHDKRWRADAHLFPYLQSHLPRRGKEIESPPVKALLLPGVGV